MITRCLKIGAIGTIALYAYSASAAGVVLTGDYLKVSVNDVGTFGQGSPSPGSSPAFIHDPTGTGTFNPSTDYISPGTPHDGFSLIADQFGFSENDNYLRSDFGTGAVTTLTGAAARGYANAVSWTGGLTDLLTITNSYFFNPGDERVLIETTIVALSDLTSLAFARSVDPDSGTSTSINQRGNSTLGIDDFVGSESSSNGRTLALVNINSNGYDHTTQINGACCSNIDPYDVLSHTGGDRGVNATGDFGLNLAYDIGSLSSGSTATFQYAYAAGLGLDDVVVPGGVPEPASWLMMILGFGAIGGMMRAKKRQTVAVSYA
jgi:hypothetical protein